MNNYEDPNNVEDIIEEIKSLPTLGDIKPLVDKYFPGWIIGTLDGYSKDYMFLENNWRTVCNMMNIKPLKIMIVDSNIVLDSSHKLISLFSEILTKSGFCVRSKNHLLPCKKCGRALPQPEFYDVLKTNNNFKIPRIWSTVCENC